MTVSNDSDAEEKPILYVGGVDVTSPSGSRAAPQPATGGSTMRTLGSEAIVVLRRNTLLPISAIEADSALVWTPVDRISHRRTTTGLKPTILQFAFAVSGLPAVVFGSPDFVAVFYRVRKNDTVIAFEGPLAASGGLPTKVKDFYIDTQVDPTDPTYTVDVVALTASYLPVGSISVGARQITLVEV